MYRYFVRFVLKSGHVLYGCKESDKSIQDVTTELLVGKRYGNEYNFKSLNQLHNMAVSLDQVASYEVGPWRSDNGDF